MENDELISDATDSLDGYFEVAVSDSGVFLKVFSPKGDGEPVKEPAIVTELQNREVKDYNLTLIIRTVKEATGVPVQIAPPPQPDGEPEVQILVSRDRLEANLVIIVPKRSRPLLLDEVLDKIREAGVTYGIDLDAVQKAFQRPGLRTVCAKGLNPIDGTDAYIKYYLDFENKGRPLELEDGRVDHKNLNTFTTVRQDEVIAEKIPAVPGTAGIDILGQPIAAKPGKDISLPLGKNVHAVDNKKIVASIAGQLMIVNNKINVIPIIEVKGDIDFSTGNIDFVGNVIIRGSVQAGFTVKAEGNVEISGTVSGGTVEGKNVIIRMGVQGMQRGYVKASENVVAKFLENATVYAGKDIIISEVVLHSKLFSGKKVIVEGRRGLIAGGQVIAGEEIRAKVAGTQLAANTDLEVGINPLLREEYQTLRQEIKKVQHNLEQTQKALVILKAMDPSSIPKEKQEMLLKLTKAQFHLVGQTETIRNRISEIELAFEEMRYGRIKVLDVVYPGVKIVVGSHVKPIREVMRFVTFYAEEDDVKVGPYK